MSVLNIARSLLSPVQANFRSLHAGNYLQFCSQGENYEKQEQVDVVQNFDDGDRSEVVDYETSIRYLRSDEYKSCYGDNLVWELYRRRAQHSRYYAVRTRKSCIRKGKLTSSSPCPICRDKYLVFDYRHTELLNQFISKHYYGVIPSGTTGICQKQYKKLLTQVAKAKDYGTISFDIPFRWYNYQHFQKACLEHLNHNKTTSS